MLYIKEIINHKIGDNTSFKSLADELGWTITLGENEVEQSEIDGHLYEKGFAPKKTDEEKEREERERIGNLTCTKRVFALMLQELGITYTQLKELIATNEQAQLEWDLCIELERKNPLLDIMALQLKVTSEQLDNLFKYANGEITKDEFIIADKEETEQVEVQDENTTDTTEHNISI